MKATKVGSSITVIIVLLALGFIFYLAPEASDQGTPPTGHTASVVVPPDLPRIVVDQQSDGLTKSMPEKRLVQSRSMLEWQRDLYDPQSTAKTFAEAVDAAEGGNLNALREVHDLLVLCKTVMEDVREGRDRERYLSGYEMSPNAMRWREQHYDRCAAIATAPTFAQWPLTEGRLTAAYWEKVGAKFDDPLLRSFAIAEDIGTHARAEVERRPALQARMVDNLQRVLRSADATAWWDLGFRLQDPRLSADKAVGIALIQVACERGYDCTKNNVHNFSLRCDGNHNPNCGSAATNLEAFTQRESAATIARAQALYERLTLILNQGDWEEIEKLVPLDGTAFKSTSSVVPNVVGNASAHQ
jgi:hypothetical protein